MSFFPSVTDFWTTVLDSPSDIILSAYPGTHRNEIKAGIISQQVQGLTFIIINKVPSKQALELLQTDGYNFFVEYQYMIGETVHTKWQDVIWLAQNYETNTSDPNECMEYNCNDENILEPLESAHAEFVTPANTVVQYLRENVPGRLMITW